jgi:hypothetical protein
MASSVGSNTVANVGATRGSQLRVLLSVQIYICTDSSTAEELRFVDATC